jgi:hypothetical protein
MVEGRMQQTGITAIDDQAGFRDFKDAPADVTAPFNTFGANVFRVRNGVGFRRDGAKREANGKKQQRNEFHSSGKIIKV